MAWDVVWVVKDSWSFTRPSGGGGHVLQAAETACIKIRSTETLRWAQREGACGAAAENKVTKGKVQPGSWQACSRGVWVRCDYAQLLQWTEPVALDALLTRSCWTQINLTDYLTNTRVKSGNSSGKRYCGWATIFREQKYYQPESEEQKDLLMLNNGTSERKASVEMWFFSPAHYETGFYFSIPCIWTDYNLYWNRRGPDLKMPHLLPFILLSHCCYHVNKPRSSWWLLPKNWNPAML